MKRSWLSPLFSILLVTACQPQAEHMAPVVQLGLLIDAPAGAVIIKDGDTLWKVANRFDLSLRDIIDTNDIRPPYILSVGQRLKLPPPRKYKAQYGDTLHSISRTFGVGIRDLVQHNRLRSPYTIKINQSLKIPYQAEQHYHRDRGTTQFSAAKPSPRPSHGQVSTVKPSRKISRKTTKRPVYGSSGQFNWPVKGPVLSSYGAKASGYHNDGINIGAPRGTPVLSAGSGSVVYVGGDLESFGNLVLVRHDNGWMTAYAHLAKVQVKRGQRLQKGRTIGTIGTTGAVTKPQLHFEIRKGTRALNPQKYLFKKA